MKGGLEDPEMLCVITMAFWFSFMLFMIATVSELKDIYNEIKAIRQIMEEERERR